MIIGAQIRFGVGDSFVDNISSGGIGVGIDLKTGVLSSTAYDIKSRKYSRHPISSMLFDGFQIPFWQDTLELARKVQLCFTMYRLLGLDIAITPNGPCLIEINDSHDNVGLEQKFGPILANEKVYQEFKTYDLFINRFQRELYSSKNE
jgi:hypothetical protein